MYKPGSTIGDYEIISHLGDGGMASLYLGRLVGSPPDEVPVAIKVIHPHLSHDWQFVRMFIDEAMISVRLRHPNVVRVDELGEQDGTYFLVMEYVHGCSLAELLRTMAKNQRRIRPDIAIHIAAQVAAGLHRAHEMSGHDGQPLGIIHRDVSPQNVLLAVSGEVKLLDFGIAKSKGRADRTETGVIKGKVRYMAPEQAGGEDVDRRVDIYALGVVLWEMLTMRRYIEGKSDLEIIRKVRSPQPVPPSARAEGIPASVDDATMEILALNPDRRPQTCMAVRERLLGSVSDSDVGPSHVAELLRVFMGPQIAEAAGTLPPVVAKPLVASVEAVKPLPGEDETTAQVNAPRRSGALTVKFEAASPPPPAGGVAPLAPPPGGPDLDRAAAPRPVADPAAGGPGSAPAAPAAARVTRRMATPAAVQPHDELVGGARDTAANDAWAHSQEDPTTYDPSYHPLVGQDGQDGATTVDHSSPPGARATQRNHPATIPNRPPIDIAAAVAERQAHTAAHRSTHDGVVATSAAPPDGTPPPAPLASGAAAPETGVPAAGVPVAGVPVAGVPVAGVPVAGAPAAGVPVAGVPVAGVPVAGVPAAGAPAAGVPAAGVPAAGAAAPVAPTPTTLPAGEPGIPWLARVLAVTVTAFVVGAGVAMAILQLLR